MVEAPLARSPLDGVLRPGRSGETSGPAGVMVSERIVAGAAGLAARAGAMAELEQAAARIGLPLPAHGQWSAAAGFELVWLGPERWLVFGQGDVERALREAMGSLASVSDQSDSRLVLGLSGLRVRDALAKGVPIDLHPRAFGPGRCAVTQAAHIGVTIWQVDTSPSFRLAVARSYATSLAEWLIGAAAEYGLDVLPPTQ